MPEIISSLLFIMKPQYVYLVILLILYSVMHILFADIMFSTLMIFSVRWDSQQIVFGGICANVEFTDDCHLDGGAGRDVGAVNDAQHGPPCVGV